jgi:hypothetical protein
MLAVGRVDGGHFVAPNDPMSPADVHETGSHTVTVRD